MVCLLLDQLLIELANRFNENARKATLSLCLVSSVMRKTHDWRHHVDSLVELFKEDLPSPLSVPSELHMWSIKFTNCCQSKLPSSPLQALIQCDEKALPNIFRLLRIVANTNTTSDDMCGQWRTQNIFMGGVIQWHMVVIFIWCALLLASQFDVILMFPNQRFGEVC